MRIRRTSVTFAAVAAVLTTTIVVTTVTARATSAAACTPAWKQIPTPHSLSNVGSVSVPGTLGAAGSVSVVSPNNVWFPFGYFDPDYGGAGQYPAAWTGRWNGQTITTPHQIPGFAGSDLFGLGSSFDSGTDGWLLVDDTRGSYTGIHNYAEHWQGNQWTLLPLAVNPQYSSTGIEPEMQAVAALSPTNAWAVGEATSFTANTHGRGALIEHWDGTAWKLVPNPLQDSVSAALNAVTAISATDIWTVGYQPGVNGRQIPLTEHWDGKTWTSVPTPAVPTGSPLASFSAVSAVGGQVWATGFQGQPGRWGTQLIERFNGTAWTVISGAPGIVPQGGMSLYAAAPDDVWTTTWTSDQIQEFLHWNGRTWTAVKTPGQQEAGLQYEYTAFGGSGPDDVWAAGSVYDGGQPDPTRNVTEAIAHLSC